MSLTRKQWEEVWDRLKKIEHINGKIWKSKHYKWSNSINWEVQNLKRLVQEVIGQME